MERDKLNTTDKMLLILLVHIVAFIVIVLIYNYNDKLVQEELIRGVFVLCTAELATMGGIKMFKKKHKNREDSND